MPTHPQPLVTIGLPVFSPGPFLRGALQSIFAQTFTDWELIVVDDGSTDFSWQMVQHLSDPRVRAFRDGHHRGLAARLNQIIGLARAPFIARMDADDLCHPERIERQLAHLQAHSEIDTLSTGLAVLDRQGAVSGWRVAPPDHESICRNPLRGFAMVHASMLSRADWARRHPYREGNRRCEDWELLMQAHRDSRFANLPDCLYFYREYDSFSFVNYARSKAHQVAGELRLGHDYGILSRAVSALRHFSHVGLYACAYTLRCHDLLIRYRSQPAPPELKSAVENAIARVAATELPDGTLRQAESTPQYLPASERAVGTFEIRPFR
ncbi:MAG: glycosyltransferase family 2 protein [Terriglobales bacterium]